jgi:HK97 family phage major capsid protein
MSKLLQLYDKRNAAVNATRAFLDAKQAVSDSLSADDSAIYDKMENEISALTKEIDRESRLSAIENDLKKPTTTPILGQPETSVQVGHKLDGVQTGHQNGRAKDEYRAAFWTAMKSKDGLEISVKNALSEGVNADGGYLVPDEYERKIIDTLEEENIFRRLANVIQTSSGGNIVTREKPPVSATKVRSCQWQNQNAG